ncbi:hypothetical protein JZ751_006774 [Albula glossodonta]|uniref:Membrane-anchored junction protein n=1 Tax=Albula glossodonta TaxID=121402 RepID=A0A8T2NZD0_9TELE|nr:hypothetical protein JZ751_006774 [Albula glossodonta]
MPIQSFSFPIPETRFFQAGHHVYKFKIRSGSKCSDEMIDNEYTNQELEDAIRVVLANLDNLQPFATKHFNIFPYRSRWERVSELQFQQGGLRLTAYPFLITLYLETHDSPQTQQAMQSGDWPQLERLGASSEGRWSRSNGWRQEASSAVTHGEGQREGQGLGTQGRHLRTVEQGDPKGPTPSDSKRDEPGFLSHVASKLFPFSLFFGSWKK